MYEGMLYTGPKREAAGKPRRRSLSSIGTIFNGKVYGFGAGKDKAAREKEFLANNSKKVAVKRFRVFADMSNDRDIERVS